MKNTEINDICKEVYEANLLKGFDVKIQDIGKTLMLVNSELCEALEADRKDKYVLPRNLRTFESDHDNKWERQAHDAFSFESNIKDRFEDEIADTFIRLMDLVGAFDIDIDKHIELKRTYNSLRSFKHGGKAY